MGGTKIRLRCRRSGGSRARRAHEQDSPETSEEAVLAALDDAVDAVLDDRVARDRLGIPSNLERGTRPGSPRDRTSRSTTSTSPGTLASVSGSRSGSRTTRTPPRWRSGSSGRDAALATSSCSTLGTGVGGGHRSRRPDLPRVGRGRAHGRRRRRAFRAKAAVTAEGTSRRTSPARRPIARRGSCGGRGGRAHARRARIGEETTARARVSPRSARCSGPRSARS